MKKFLNEYLNIIMYAICGVLIVLSSYTIIININHAKFLNKDVLVSDMDIDFKLFKDNIIKIDDILDIKDNYYLKSCLNILKNDGLYKKIPGDKLTYEDLYYLNNYFIEFVINDGYVSNLKSNNLVNELQKEFVNNLIFNANYITSKLENNSNYQYDVLNNDNGDSINIDYKMILKNYKEFSYILLEMCDSL